MNTKPVKIKVGAFYVDRRGNVICVKSIKPVYRERRYYFDVIINTGFFDGKKSRATVGATVGSSYNYSLREINEWEVKRLKLENL